MREPQTHAISPAAETGAAAEKMTVLQMFGYRNIILCCAMCCFMVAWMVLGWVFLPLVYENYLHIPSEQASWLMALLGISAAVFAFIVPGLSDKLGRKPVVIVFSLIGVIYPLAVLNYTGSAVVLGHRRSSSAGRRAACSRSSWPRFRRRRSRRSTSPPRSG